MFFEKFSLTHHITSVWGRHVFGSVEQGLYNEIVQIKCVIELSFYLYVYLVLDLDTIL